MIIHWTADRGRARTHATLYADMWQTISAAYVAAVATGYAVITFGTPLEASLAFSTGVQAGVLFGSPIQAGVTFGDGGPP